MDYGDLWHRESHCVLWYKKQTFNSLTLEFQLKIYYGQDQTQTL